MATIPQENEILADRRALLLVNRRSRGGEQDLSPAAARLERHGISIIEEPIDDPGRIGATIEAHCREIDRVIVAGGDGTINAAIEPLLACGLPLGILPVGTANDLARTLAIPTDIEAACDIIAGGRLHQIDLGEVNGKHFFNVASLGISVEVAHRLTPQIKRRWGWLSYLFTLAKALRRGIRPFRATIVCDGRTVRVVTIQISVGNGRFYGGGFAVASDAAIDDARLDVYSLRPLGLWQLLRLAPAVYQGEHGRSRDRVRFLHGRDIDVRTRRPMPIDTDGEVTARTPARFRVVPRALAVFVPAAPSDREEE